MKNTPALSSLRNLFKKSVLTGVVGAGFASVAFSPAIFAQAPAAPAASPAAAPAPTTSADDFYQFVNGTGGAFTDAQISWTPDGKTWHTLAEAKSCPAMIHNGRINFKLSNDKGTWQDFIEFNQDSKGNWYGNTTYVDAFVFPMTIELFNPNGTSKKMGITQSRAAILAAFKKEAPPEFQACLQGDKRIVSPHQADMADSKPNANYFGKYIDQIYAMYATPKTFPSGWTAQVKDGVLTFSKPGSKDIVVADKKDPTKKLNTRDILLCIGTASDPGLCAAFNRHIAAADPVDWRSPAAADTFYKELPYNFYAKFMHEHTIDGKAYGFCYDDVSNQASYMQGPASKLVVTIYWDAPPATATATK